MKKKNRLSSFCYLGTITALMVIVVGCSLLPKEEAVLAPPLVEPAKIEYNVAPVQKGDLIKKVRGTGSLVPIDFHDLFYSKEGGRLKEVRVTEGDIVEKGQTLATIDTGDLIYDIDQVKLELDKAKLRLKQLEAQQSDEYSIEIGKIDVKGLELRLYQLNRQLNEAKINSPINGVVTYVGELMQGELVPAYQSVIQVAETSDLQLQYSAVNASDLTDVTVGMAVDITLSGETVGGKVVQTPQTVPMDIFEQDPELHRSSLLIRLETIPDDVWVGDIAELEIITAEKENTLMIPVNGLRTSSGRNYVQVRADNTSREVDIEVGIISTTEVEVLKGLEEGDEVILR